MRFLAVIGLFILLFGCVLPGSNTGVKQDATQNTTHQPPASVQPSEPPSQIQPSHPQPGLLSYEISYKSNGWVIYGTLYPSNKTASKLIILVPGLGTSRDQYPQDFVSSLHDAVPDALILAIDPRGHGKSTNLGTWNNFDYSTFLNMRGDVIDAKPYILGKFPTVKQIYVVGASVGSTSALLAAAQEKYITKVAMVSPGIAFNNVDISAPGALDSYSQQLLVVASQGDTYSLNSAYEISSLTSPSQTTMKIYAGSAHGTALFDDTKGDKTPLSELLIEFLSK